MEMPSHKTNHNKHFPGSFLLNYDAAIEDPSEEAILARLHDFNCEWLQRPNIALLEMAQTLRENIPLIRQFNGTVFVPQFVDDLLTPLEGLTMQLSRLDKRQVNEGASQSEDVISLLRSTDGNQNLSDSMMDGFNAAGPLLIMCIHLSTCAAGPDASFTRLF